MVARETGFEVTNNKQQKTKNKQQTTNILNMLLNTKDM